MKDYGAKLRQDFIKSNNPLAIKLAALRERLHKENCYLLGEEILARRNGGSIFSQRKGWERK